MKLLATTVMMLVIIAPLTTHAEEIVTIDDVITGINDMMQLPLRVSPSIVFESFIGDDTSITYVYTMRQLKADIDLIMLEIGIRGDKTAAACLMFREGVENLEGITHEYFDGDNPRTFLIAITLTEADCLLR